MFLLALLTIALLSATAMAQPAAPGMPARAIVTVEVDTGDTAPQITGEDVVALQGKERARISGWTPVRTAGLQLWILIDDGSQGQLALQYPELKKFIGEQPANTRIGVGYMRNGIVLKGQDLTTDHDAAQKALRLPIGLPGIDASPYTTVEDLIKKWPGTPQAREVLMITSGIDPLNGPGPVDPYLDEAIETAQRAGVPVYSIYWGGAGHLGHSLWQATWGQMFLSKMADATGAEMYWEGSINPVTIAPYLEDINAQLGRQYIATFLLKHEGKPGLESVKFTTEVPHATLHGPQRVWAGGPK